jgi:hypothetical protein
MLTRERKKIKKKKKKKRQRGRVWGRTFSTFSGVPFFLVVSRDLGVECCAECLKGTIFAGLASSERGAAGPDLAGTTSYGKTSCILCHQPKPSGCGTNTKNVNKKQTLKRKGPNLER